MNPRVLQISASLIREVSSKKKASSIDLGLGEPSLLPNLAHFEAAMRRVAERGVKYTPNAGDPVLREAIARCYGYPGMDRAANVCVTVGSQEAMYVTLKTLLDPARDELLIVEPAFPSYQKMATVEGIAVRSVAMREEDDFEFDAERIVAARALGRGGNAPRTRARTARRRAGLADSRRNLPRTDFYRRCGRARALLSAHDRDELAQ
jgi:aspartate/methionine/tyrosine aminotransferase